MTVDEIETIYGTELKTALSVEDIDMTSLSAVERWVREARERTRLKVLSRADAYAWAAWATYDGRRRRTSAQWVERLKFDATRPLVPRSTRRLDRR